MTTTTRPSRLADLLPRPALRAPAMPTPAPTEKVQPDAPDPELCHGYWSGPDAAHMQNEPCLNPAVWSGLSDHKHAKTTLRCNAHRQLIDLSIGHDVFFCLTCHRHIRTMAWRELS